MKYQHVRKAVGYCCRMCDGPYSKYKKLCRRAIKKSDKREAKKKAAEAIAEMDKDGFALD